jgi:hypothetical protein
LILGVAGSSRGRLSAGGARRSTGVYSIPGESRSLRPRFNPASPSPAKQRRIIAQVGNSGTGSALLTVEVEAGVGLSESGAGCKAPKS